MLLEEYSVKAQKRKLDRHAHTHTKITGILSKPVSHFERLIVGSVQTAVMLQRCICLDSASSVLSFYGELTTSKFSVSRAIFVPLQQTVTARGFLYIHSMKQSVKDRETS